MMNLRNLGSKENLAIKFKDGICADLCLNLWFESDIVIFVILMSHYGFETDCPERKFQTITSSSQIDLRKGWFGTLKK